MISLPRFPSPPVSVAAALVAGLLLTLPVNAQTPLAGVAKTMQGGAADESKKDAPAAADDLKRRLSEAQGELSAIDAPQRLASGAPAGTSPEELQRRVRALRLMVFSYRQHLMALGNLADLKKLDAESEARRRAAVQVSASSLSVLVVDGMRAELQSALLDLRSDEARLQILDAQIEIGREASAKAAERQRLAQDALEAAKPADFAAATWRRDLAVLEVTAQGVYFESLLALRKSVEAATLGHRQTMEFQRRRLSDAERSVVFKPEDLTRLQSAIDERRAATIKALDAASRERERAAAEADKAIAAAGAADKLVLELEQRVSEARRAVSAAEAEVAKAENPEGFLQKVNPFRGRAARSELEKRQREAADFDRQLSLARAAARQRERESLLAIERSRNAVQSVEAQNTGLITLDMQRRFWDLRFAVHDPAAQGQLDRRKLAEGGRRLLKVLNPAIDHLRSKLEVVIGQLSEQNGFLRAADDAAEVAFRKAMIELLEQRERSFLVATAEVEEIRHLLMRWLEEADLRAEGLTAGERALDWFGATDDWLKAAWNFELFAVEDTIVVDGRTITGSRGVTVAKVVRAILIVVIGYALIAFLTRFAMQAAVRRGRMEETSARIARKWVLAVTLVILLLLALDVVKIPLTAFAFLGGAIAIGAGFGMQTLLKNLISGVMLLMERPFKPRDIVEVGGIRGEVTDINVRSCTIRDVNGIETLVPNSTFLEQNVTNWTLSSRKVRYTLNIGVGYGSPVRRVHDLLLEVADRHNQVLKDPAPEVLFMDFGDNALMFALFVWIEVGPGRRGGNVILSDLRFMIDAAFTEHGIEIPFPQRDVHLDAGEPLPVRVVPASDPA